MKATQANRDVPAPVAPSPVAPLVSIVITTRNRKDELMVALASCLEQTYRPLEVVVYDDASSDGTAEAVCERFPEVRVVELDQRAQIVPLRNRALRETRGEFVVSIDDDCYFTDPNSIAEVVACFKAHPRAAVVALNMIEPTRPRHPDWRGFAAPPGTELAQFRGGASALRKSAILELGGYRDCLLHQQEEADLSLRILDADWAIVYAGVKPLVHTYSPRREPGQQWLYGIRNSILVKFLNAPLVYLVPHLAASCYNALAYRFSFRALPWKLWAVAVGLGACVRYAGLRRPVRIATYKRFRQLPHHSPEAFAAE